MGYKYIRDIHIEEPFYHTMAAKLKGIKCRETFYGSNTGTYSVECPCCKKRKQEWVFQRRRILLSLVVQMILVQFMVL